MKRLLIGALAVLMVCSLSIVGFAQTLDQDNPTGAVTIRTTYGEEDIKYAIQIPADTEIPWTAEKTSLAYVPTLMQLEAGKKVVVTVAGEHNALRLDSAQSTMQLPYQLSGAVTADFYGRLARLMRRSLSSILQLRHGMLLMLAIIRIVCSSQ